jgi:alanine racemase
LASNDIAIPGDAGATLVVDLDAITDNFGTIQSRCPGVLVGASVKADAYGLGLAPVARTLAQAGCTTFFVATPGEGHTLRDILPDAGIVVLNGPTQGQTDIFHTAKLSPTLNSLEQIAAWQDSAANIDDAPRAWLHADTGMNRLGLSSEDVDILVSEPERLKGITVSTLISHLACADTPEHPMNGTQRDAFRSARRRIEACTGPLQASLANSPGVFLGPDFHFDLVRPGAALYGLAPSLDRPNPMKQVVVIHAKILQVRNVDTPMTVGYGAAHYVDKPTRIATIAAGYADGYPRAAAGNTGVTMHAYIAGHAAPICGRVSMDLMTFDVSGIPEDLTRPGRTVELLGPHVSADELATASGTIGYEVLARLGSRLHRVYKGGQA